MNGARGNAWNIGGGDPVVLKGELPRVQPPSSPAFPQMPTMSSSETKGARARPYRRVLQLSEEASVHTQVVAECFFLLSIVPASCVEPICKPCCLSAGAPISPPQLPGLPFPSFSSTRQKCRKALSGGPIHARRGFPCGFAILESSWED